MTLDIEKIQREILTDEVYRQVGDIHLLILLSVNKLDTKQLEPINHTVKFDLSSQKLTAFGKATVGDFTGYFLRNNIERLLDLLERLDNLHPHLDKLKRDSKELIESYEVSNYHDFIKLIRQFFVNHKENIGELHTVLKYLEDIDELAPAIFFTQPQWSQSQRSSRYIKIKSKDDVERLIDRSADVVSGLHSHYGPTYYNIQSDLEADYASSVDPEKVRAFLWLTSLNPISIK